MELSQHNWTLRRTIILSVNATAWSYNIMFDIILLH